MPLKITSSASDSDKHEYDITHLLYINGKVYSASDDGKIKIWTSDLIKINEVQAHPCSVYCLAYGDSTLWSCSNDGTIKIWDPDTLTSRGILVDDNEVEFQQIGYCNGCFVSADDKGNVVVYKNRQVYGQINVAEPVKAMKISGSLIFTVRDLDLVITEMKIEKKKIQHGVKQVFMGRAPVTLIGDTLFAYSTREGKEIVVHENNLENNFKAVARITNVSDLLLNALDGVRWPNGDQLFSGGWDKVLKQWVIIRNCPEYVSSLNVNVVITTIKAGDEGHVYVGGAEGHLLKVSVVS